MEMLIGVIIGAFLSSALGAYIGSVKGNTPRGFCLGLILGPIGWIITAILPTEQAKPQPGAYSRSHARPGRICSLCGRSNVQGSVKCSECGATL